MTLNTTQIPESCLASVTSRLFSELQTKLEDYIIEGLKRTTFQSMLNNQNPNKTNFKYYD